MNELLRAREPARRPAPVEDGPVAAPRRRKVALVGPTPPPYHGNAFWTRQLLGSAELSAHYDVVHLETADRRSLANMGRLDARNVVLALRHAAGLARLIRREQPDVVYIQIAQNALACLRDALLLAVAHGSGRRVAVHLLGSDYGRLYRESGAALRWVMRRSARWFDAAAALSEGLRPVYEGLVPPERVHVAPEGIPDPFPEGPPRRERAARAPLTVTYLGMLFRPKGILELLRAAAALRGTAPPLRFVFAGPWYSEEDRSAADELIRTHGLEDTVSFPGVVDGEAKRRLWCDTDIFVFPGWQPEGAPFVVLEAMAAGVPVIATTVGATPDVLAGGAGVLVPPADVPALVEGIRALAQDPAQRRRLGAAARARFLSDYTDARAALAVVALLEHAVAA